MCILNKAVRAEVILRISPRVCVVVSVLLHATAACPRVGGFVRASNVDTRSSQRNMWPKGVLALGGAGDAEDVDVEVTRRDIHGNEWEVITTFARENRGMADWGLNEQRRCAKNTHSYVYCKCGQQPPCGMVVKYTLRDAPRKQTRTCVG